MRWFGRRGRWLSPPVLAGGFLILGWIVICGVAWLSPFPELAEFIAQPISRRITDRQGGLLLLEHLTDGTHREWIDLDEIPPGVVEAFIAGEDSRFYSHQGIDPAAVLRAFVQNRATDQIVSGASTITMQLARLVVPHRGGMGGKLQEMWNALRLELRLSKHKILELYLNRVPFGRGREGVASASKEYFARQVQSLSPSQGAVLSVIPRAPTGYDPSKNPQGLAAAAYLVAARMRPPMRPADIREAVESSQGLQTAVDTRLSAPHFALRVSTRIPQLTHLHPSSRAQVRTSLDPDIQDAAQSLLSQAIIDAQDNRIQNGAVLVISNATGEIMGYVGSPDFYDEQSSGQIDGVQIRRQPGSTLKPFLYAMALDEGFTAASILPDIPLALGGSEVYIPLNFNQSYSGPVRLREALASSLNVPAVWMVTRVGVANFVDFLINLGFEIKTQRAQVGSGIALGNVEVTLEELTRGYTAFVNQGRPFSLSYLLQPPDFVHSYDHPPPMTPGTAGIIRDILGDDAARTLGFGHYALLNTDYPSFFKTGTANQFSNIWAVGVSPLYTVGVWMGNVHGQTVQGITGSSLPARVAVGILDAFTPPSARFPELEGVHEVWISSVSGMVVDPGLSYAVREFFPESYFPPTDTWHQGPSGRIKYPPEYQLWLQDYRTRSQPHPGVPSQEGGTIKWARILQPNPGAQFFDDPYLRLGDSQALRIQAIGEVANLELTVDGASIHTGPPPISVYIPLTPGRHTIRLLNSETGRLLDQSWFQVDRTTTGD